LISLRKKVELHILVRSYRTIEADGKTGNMMGQQTKSDLQSGLHLLPHLEIRKIEADEKTGNMMGQQTKPGLQSGLQSGLHLLPHLKLRKIMEDNDWRAAGESSESDLRQVNTYGESKDCGVEIEILSEYSDDFSEALHPSSQEKYCIDPDAAIVPKQASRVAHRTESSSSTSGVTRSSEVGELIVGRNESEPKASNHEPLLERKKILFDRKRILLARKRNFEQKFSRELNTYIVDKVLESRSEDERENQNEAIIVKPKVKVEVIEKEHSSKTEIEEVPRGNTYNIMDKVLESRSEDEREKATQNEAIIAKPKVKDEMIEEEHSSKTEIEEVLRGNTNIVDRFFESLRENEREKASKNEAIIAKPKVKDEVIEKEHSSKTEIEQEPRENFPTKKEQSMPANILAMAEKSTIVNSVSPAAKYLSAISIPVIKIAPTREVKISKRLCWVKYRGLYWWPALLYDDYSEIQQQSFFADMSITMKLHIAFAILTNRERPEIKIVRMLGQSWIELVEVKEEERCDFHKGLPNVLKVTCDKDVFFGNSQLYYAFHRALDQVENIRRDGLDRDFELVPGETQSWLEQARAADQRRWFRDNPDLTSCFECCTGVEVLH
jgi:hypothetical protein